LISTVNSIEPKYLSFLQITRDLTKWCWLVYPVRWRKGCENW